MTRIRARELVTTVRDSSKLVKILNKQNTPTAKKYKFSPCLLRKFKIILGLNILEN